MTQLDLAFTITCMPDINESVISTWEAAWDRGEVSVLDVLMDPEYTRESAGTGTTTGLAELKQDILDVRAAFPDLRTSVDKLIIDGDDFAIFWSSTGTFTNPLGEVPATGSRVQTRGSNQGTFRNGRIIHERVTWDKSELLADLGLERLQFFVQRGVSRAGRVREYARTRRSDGDRRSPSPG